MADKQPAKSKSGKRSKAAAPQPRLRDHYYGTVRSKLMEEFGVKNIHQAPRLVKIVLNVGLGEAPKTPKLLDAVVEELAIIAGQRPVVTRAKKAISNFSLRAGMPIGGGGDIARCAHVGVSRPVHCYNRAAYSRLPRVYYEFFRWAWKLYDSALSIRAGPLVFRDNIHTFYHYSISLWMDANDRTLSACVFPSDHPHPITLSDVHLMTKDGLLSLLTTRFLVHQRSHLQNLRSQGDDLHESLLTEFSSDGPEYPSCPRLPLIIYQHGGIVIKTYVTPILAPSFLCCAHDHTFDDFSFFSLARQAMHP